MKRTVKAWGLRHHRGHAMRLALTCPALTDAERTIGWRWVRGSFTYDDGTKPKRRAKK